MKSNEIARALARRRHISHAEAKDKVDELVHRILTSLRDGRPAVVPGVGDLVRVSPQRQPPGTRENGPA